MRTTFTKKLKTILLVIFGVVVLLFIIHYFASNYIEKKINVELKSDSNVEYTYSKLNLNLFFGDATIKDIFYKDVTDSLNSKKITISSAKITGFSYLNYLNNNSFKLNNVILDSLSVELNDTGSDSVKSTPKPKNLIFLNNLIIKNGTFKFFKKSKSPEASIKNFNAKFESVSNSPTKKVNSLNNFCFKNLTAKLSDTDIKISDLDRVNIKETQIQPKKVYLKEINLKSIYGQRELSQYITSEKDHVDLFVPELTGKNWSIKNPEKILSIKVDSTTIKTADLTLFRDKAVADSKVYKSLYAEKLKQMNLKIDFPSIKVIDSKITYLQLMEGNPKPGELFFNKVNADLTVTNNNERKTPITYKANALFMGKSPVTLTTKFSPDNTSNFLAKGTIDDFKGTYINDFLEKNLRTHIMGNVDKLYFTISGNNNTATGDVKMKYSDLELEILKKDVLEVNKFLTTIGNMILPKNDKKDSEGYRYGKIEVDRDQTKSFFNFLWISLRDGIKNTITGNNPEK